jgi:small subunit ribosomal protein S9
MHVHTKTNAVGRRKTSVARVILINGNGKMTINGKPLEQYFPLATQRAEVTQPLVATQSEGKYDVRVNVEGGGMSGQAGAIKLSLARALVEMSEENRSSLRKEALLTRDPRMVERKKYGMKKARKRFQFSKR